MQSTQSLITMNPQKSTQYVKTLGLIITQNVLTDFDEASLLAIRSKKGISL